MYVSNEEPLFISGKLVVNGLPKIHSADIC